MKRLVTLSLAMAIPAQAASQGAQVTAPSQSSITIPTNTEVVLRTSDELTSKGKQNKVGDTFRLTVAYDVKVGGVTVIPSGTPAIGEITYKTGKAVFGKSGKMEVELRSVDLNGQRIPITGKYRQEGEGNTTAAIGAVVLAAGLLFVTGKSAVIPRGRELVGFTQQAVTVPVKPAL